MLFRLTSPSLQGGKSLYNGPSIRWRREQAGTVVCIRDAFYNVWLIHTVIMLTNDLNMRSYPYAAGPIPLHPGHLISYAKILNASRSFSHMFPSH